MVRLKGEKVVKIFFKKKYFNSTMVRLKAWELVEIIGSHLNFNSTMVRLKGIDGVAYGTGVIQFQFHYGSVKRWV